MVTCELSRVGCCLRRRQQQISTCRSQEGGKSLSRAENDPRRLSQKVSGKVALRVRPIAGERRQHHSHCSYNTRTPQRMTARQSHRHPSPSPPTGWWEVCAPPPPHKAIAGVVRELSLHVGRTPGGTTAGKGLHACVSNDARWCPPGLRTEASRTGMSGPQPPDWSPGGSGLSSRNSPGVRGRWSAEDLSKGRHVTSL